MKQFIKVTGQLFNSQGLTNSQSVPRQEFYLNMKIIVAIKGNNVHVEDGPILKLGSSHYKELKLHDSESSKDLT